MSDYNFSPDHPWDDGVYGTGQVQPPKNYGGVIAVLLILVIFLSGVITMLGIMNVRLFRKLNTLEEESSITFAAEQIEAPAEPERAFRETAPTAETEDSHTIDLETVPADPEPAEAMEQSRLSLQEIYRQCIPSVVSITCDGQGVSSTGTGVVLTQDGYLVTNHHVITNALRITVQLTDDRVFPATVVGSDAATDLAVLHIDAEGLTPAVFGDSEELQVGDSVVAIGDPLGVKYRGTMTDGIISAINRNVTLGGRSMNLIQTNAALNSGNSGGPLINCYGQVIGINTMKISFFADTAGVEGIGFAIPSCTVKDIVNQIIAQGYVSGRPDIGIRGEGLSIFYQRYYRLPAGLYITYVDPGCDAAAQGIQEADILLSVDDVKIYSMEDLTTLLYNYSAGDTVTAVIYRGGQTAAFRLTLSEANG